MKHKTKYEEQLDKAMGEVDFKGEFDRGFKRAGYPCNPFELLFYNEDNKKTNYLHFLGGPKDGHSLIVDVVEEVYRVDVSDQKPFVWSIPHPEDAGIPFTTHYYRLTPFVHMDTEYIFLVHESFVGEKIMDVILKSFFKEAENR